MGLEGHGDEEAEKKSKVPSLERERQIGAKGSDLTLNLDFDISDSLLESYWKSTQDERSSFCVR